MNQPFLIFLPHLFGTASVLLILTLGWRTPIPTLFVSLPICGLLFLLGVGLTPSCWLRAKTTVVETAAPLPTTAVILGFGYEGEGATMRPGEANQFLVDWLLQTQPQVTTFLVQEGVRSAMQPGLLQDKAIHRIHRHDPAVYVDTLDTAFCALHQLQQLKAKTVLLVAHDLQLQRAVWDFERVRQAACAQCTIVVAAMPDTPYPKASVHVQTRNEFIYKLTELLYLRPRDFLRAVPTQCKAPLQT
ncbi:MAG: hypothetical protein R3E79_11465 [Caldilineaceae bacterium]